MSLYKNKKVVVTGGSGFVGTHFIQELLDRGAGGLLAGMGYIIFELVTRI